MQVIRYMKFTPTHSDPFYFVGTDLDKMHATAQHVDPAAGDGEEVNSERVLDAAGTDERKRAIFEDGVRAAKSGVTDYYLFG